MPKYSIDSSTLTDVADAVRELDGNPDTMTPAQMASRIRAVQPGGADLSVIADDYDATATYDVGDYCIHEGGLYVCTTSISTAEAWIAGHWEEVTVGSELSDLKSDFSQLIYEHTSLNLYDKDTCNHQDGKVYNSQGTALVNSASYAVTGKMPVQPNTQYIFYAGENVRVRYVVYFSGDSGQTFIQEYSINGAAFTTPANCTFVDFELFASSHTEEQYETAINNAQLNLGSEVQPYEPYGSFTTFSLPAMAEDEGKALTVKKVSNGRVIEWEYGESGGGGGTSETDKTLTLEDVPADAKAVGDNLDEIAPLHQSKNLYDKDSCNPQDGKLYGNNGSLISGERYAITGKIPVEPSTQYIFSTGGVASVKYVDYFSGDGSTWIREETINGSAFTTPDNCTFIDIVLFGTTHTEEQFNSAIAVAQLEKGNVSTPYVPYSVIRKVETESLVDADAVNGAKNGIVAKSLVNLYDKSLAEDNKVFNSGQGKTASSPNFAFSGLIPVEPDTHYCFSIQKGLSVGYISQYYQEWTETKTYIGETGQGSATTFINQIHTGSTTRYVSFNIYFNGSHTTEQFNTAINTIMLCEGTQRPSSYVAYNEEPVINHLKLDDMYRRNDERFTGKTWLVTGTSVSYQDSKAYTEGVAEGEVVNGYIGDIARRKRMVITNAAISGSTLADTSQDSSLINRYQSLNFANYDFITVEYGINDFGHNVPVGTANDAAGTSTFAACLKTIIEYALTQNPIVGLIICTDPDVRGTTKNTNNNTLQDYADVTIEIAKQYRLPICDWFYSSGINSLTRGDGSSRFYLTQAGTHPSVYGHMRMGAMLNQVFDSMIC